MRRARFSHFALVLFLVSEATLGLASNPNSDDAKFCRSEICDRVGSEIIDSVDRSVEPCDDFYNHACGGWIARHSKPQALRAESRYKDFVKKLGLQLRDLLQEMVQQNEDGGTMGKVTNYYRSCLDMAAINARALSPLDTVVSAIEGWPLTLPANGTSHDRQSLSLQKIHEYYVRAAARSALFDLRVLPDRLNPKINLLHWTRPSSYSVSPIDRQRSYASRRDRRSTLDSYANYAAAVAEEIALLRGSNVSSADIEGEIVEMLEFGKSLDKLYSNVVSKAEYDKGPFHRVTTIAEVQSTWDAAVSGYPDYAVDWLEMIRSAFEGTGIAIDATEKIVFGRKNIVEGLAKLLTKNSLRSVVNYVHWQAIDDLVAYTIPYEDNDDQRSLFCTDYHKMREGLSYAYVRKYFSDKAALTNVNEMVTQIQEEMKRRFDRSTWMDDEDKSRSKEKLDDMLKNIGYPGWYDEAGKIDEYYDELEIGADYFENAVNYNRFARTRSLKKLREPHDRFKAEWPLLPTTPNAFYSRNLNALTIPAAYFQMPIFHVDRPLAMNYGSVGVIIGHEISHGFDSQGIMYDRVGDKNQCWSKSTIARYDDLVKCIADQYSNYTLYDDYMNATYSIDGRQTLQENAGDYAGFAIALAAYRYHKKARNLEDIVIPALANYTDDKLFFYSLSNRLCEFEGREALPNYWNYRSVPARLRVNGVLSNMREFSEAFDCPSGSPMNPAKKCVLWE